jgi:hypothetical protein
MARLETRQPPPHPPCLVSLLPSARRRGNRQPVLLRVVTMRRAVLCPVLDAAQRTQIRPGNGPASHASVTMADHVSAGDCASISTVTRGVVGVAAVAGAPSMCLLALALAALRPSSGRRPPIHAAAALDAIARGRCPVCAAHFKIPSSCPPARLPACPTLPSLRPTLPPGMSVHRPPVCPSQTLAPARSPPISPASTSPT